MNQITGATQLLGVIGDPISHSLSPVMHNAALEALGLNYVYVPFQIKPQNLKTAIAGFAVIGVKGFSVTIPHKLDIIPLLSQVSQTAKLVGAVNTVWYTETGWCGTNTDVAGFLAPLKTLSYDWSQITPVILGNGGAARAVVVGCTQLGCPEINIVGRDPEKLELFKHTWNNLSSKINIYLPEQLPELLPQTQLLVNTTPVGMYPKIDQSPIEAKILEKLAAGAIAYDLIYTPNPTQFLQKARQQGAIIIDGLEMLVKQGAFALKIWTEKEPPIEIMERSLKKYLKID
ncbi:shikimate dehydrogenase [Aphanothece hegewaldii CCALA 016]|uniref:Shikimate dehydrogenase (NADP(+)) n=1 Tax=Aphanothece hegewaldii CCALA 016 TaxID=2107694 RepID=A0A2T1LZK7_9CHRO|nr:shikimate dehydrogenase [Aphanothece hegewaldii]PSF37776.1 shikimate dehydrogenase [Aphanothece hegewaldii CCALA 016]